MPPQIARCPVCHSEGDFKIAEPLNEGAYLLCPGCGIQFVHPMGYSPQYYDDTCYNTSYALKRLEAMERNEMLNSAAHLIPPEQRLAISWLKFTEFT